MTLRKYDYTGKQVFLGIDVHKKKYVIAAICEREVVKKWSMLADPTALKKQILKMFQGAEVSSAYEAGFSGLKLHRTLKDGGINNIIVNAASVELAANDRVKTDRRDATRIAQQLAVGRLESIYIASEKEESDRALTRGREQAVKRKVQAACRIKGKLHYLGLTVADKVFTEKLVSEIEALELDAGQKFSLNEACRAWREANASIKRFEAKLKEVAQEDPKEKIYRSCPGIGRITSRILSAELGDMSRFSNERQLFSYTGLTPSEFSSGEHVRRGHISRQGSARVRGVLIEVAWVAIRHDSSLREFYYRVSSRRGGKRAIVAVARKLLGRVRACFQNNTEWKNLAA